MFGKNQILKPVSGDGSFLDIVKIFPTIQGEGPRAGQPAIFLRLGGCNLACSFCDTEFDEFSAQSVEEIIERVLRLRGAEKLVVITGGEPLRQPIQKLCAALITNGFVVQIETNGTLFRELPAPVEIVCSPKQRSPIRPDLLACITAWKFVISKTLPEYSSVPEVGQSQTNAPVYVQPIDEYDEQKNAENVEFTKQLAIKNNYIFSLQLHKILEIE